ncbi:MAG: DUF4124 domain-containing protein [Desulfosarcinaceae bacterium]
MRTAFKLILAAALFLGLSSGWMHDVSQAGDTIYTWTDSDGVKHYSTTAPADEKVKPEVYVKGDGNGPAEPDNGRRRSFDSMVDNARNESRRLEQERIKAEALRRKQEKEAAENRRREAVETRRRELQKQIDALKGRGLSPTFSQGMRDSQIKAIQEQMDQLDPKNSASKSTK